jgi:hypothetical protein
VFATASGSYSIVADVFPPTAPASGVWLNYTLKACPLGGPIPKCVTTTDCAVTDPDVACIIPGLVAETTYVVTAVAKADLTTKSPISNEALATTQPIPPTLPCTTVAQCTGGRICNLNADLGPINNCICPVGEC